MMPVTLTARDSDTQCSDYEFHLFHKNGPNSDCLVGRNRGCILDTPALRLCF